jgi:hypothetical protein
VQQLHLFRFPVQQREVVGSTDIKPDKLFSFDLMFN